MNFVEQLFGHRRARDLAARTRDLGDDEIAVFAHLADRKAKPRETLHVLDAGIGEIAAGDLAGTFEEMADHGALAEQVPVLHRPAEFMNQRPEKQRRVGRPACDDDIGAAGKRLGDGALRRYRHWLRSRGCRAL